jgi:putative PEP-CTERM system histidine kinase
VAFWGYGLAALAYVVVGLYGFLAWRSTRAGTALFAALAVSCAWALCAAIAARMPVHPVLLLTGVFDVLRCAAWYVFLILLLRAMAAARSRWPEWMAATVVAAQLGGLALEELGAGLSPRLVFAVWLGHAIFGLILIEQLYRGMSTASRWGVKPLCLGLGAAYVFELYLFADGSLFGRLDEDVLAMRGVAHALLLPLIAVSGSRNPSWALPMSMSRDMVFHSTALAISGLYLLVISAAAYYVRYVGGGWGRALQMTLLFAGLVLLVLLLFSGAQRARLRVFINKHLFSYRYDYRNEWLRFTQALTSAEGGLDLGQSVIKALSDLVESPGGCLWLRDADGRFQVHSCINQPRPEVTESIDAPLCRYLEEREWIINLEEYRFRPAVYGGLVLPEWLSIFPGAWLVIPLKSSATLSGFVVLSTPRVAFEIDWEVLDLLKTAQRQAAGYLERMQATTALLEARKFDSFNRMSAFVVHDLKNLVAQLSLLMKNAERHKANPEFQQDMLETVSHVEAKMRALMGQLQEKSPIDPPRIVNLVAIASRVCRIKRGQVPEISLIDETQGVAEALAHPERLERIMGHIVQNALDATNDTGKVGIRIAGTEEGGFRMTVEDDGCGMSEEFLRERLSRPFETTKASGMGIGVFETRQYVNEIGGTLRFHSEEGRGTRVTMDLPRAARGLFSQQYGVESLDV